MVIREFMLQTEQETLSRHAALSVHSKGRSVDELPCPVRTDYQRDRDRIIHSSAFRRLKDKTQVFLSPERDHYRTRLTHTLEVSQIARTIVRALHLNEDLTEAIALGHDLGHTPYGHAGERALEECFGRFKHYEQSVRVVEFLENDGKGLNLTYEVRNGILCHTTGTPAETLEGRILKLADRIAYVNHDIDDAIRAGVMKNEDIPAHIRAILGETKSKRIGTLVLSAIETTQDSDVASLAPEIGAAFDELHKFMFANVYTNPVCKGEESKVRTLILSLYEFFVKHPDRLPDFYREIANNEGIGRAVCDYISGMSDRYAKNVYTALFIPKSWEE
ncbi:MAG: deoxyguanosinetriphosphate triphosphohydrolase [Oscillospiraceae bacterium]|jgi:dGTPase|nr:deoxyguanosinetriphosphate triphosphohydrolase [Oscillospiraceae bacterium]